MKYIYIIIGLGKWLSKQNKMTPKHTNLHSALYSTVFREPKINADFRNITEAGRAEAWTIYFYQKGTFKNTCLD